MERSPSHGRATNVSLLKYCCILSCFLWFAITACGSVDAGEHGAEVPGNNKTTLAEDKRFLVSVSYQQLDYPDMKETYTFSPLDSFFPPSGDTWLRDWQEERLYATFSYKIYEIKHFSFTTGLHLGVNRAEFSASNVNTGFSEWWETEPSLFWGGYVRAELNENNDSGVFARFIYDLSFSGADEEEEIIVSGRGDPSGRGRDASFAWRNQELITLVGWRYHSLAPMIGVSWRRFDLTKTLDYHIEGETGSPRDSVIEAALNDTDSRYSYQNDDAVSLLLALDWAVYESVIVSAVAHIKDNPDWTLRLSYGF